MVDKLTCVQNQVRVLEKINQELDEELHKSVQKSTAQGVRISTHEVTIGQQDIRIKRLEETLENLVGKKEATTTDVSAIYREKYPSVFQPVPYPYTNPVRDIIIFKKGKK
jgi:benzoyl-CoA reductase/2-hydroxyglutaryl-CoA dehydratase subunit BcrC/BadD/HgdB